MIGIDLFCGAGGMALGARQAGIKVCLAIDSDCHATSTYAHNHRQTRTLSMDIRSVTTIPGQKVENLPKIIFGGPPCQGFSTSNQRTRKVTNPLNWLFLEYMRIVKLWKPDWIVLENVKGMSDTERGFFLDSIVTHLESAGYVVSWWILNAADFGVPQIRQRLFIIGSLHGIKVEKPQPTSEQPVTVGEAIGDLPEIGNGASTDVLPYRTKPRSSYAKKMRGRMTRSSNNLVTKNADYIIERYKFIPPGGNWENIPLELMLNYSNPRNCHTGVYHRLADNKPSVVIGNFRKNMLIHPKQNRGLSVREAARLQSFPDSYEFKGSIGFQQQQVGNAVPPLVAKAVFESILRLAQ
ncbi:MAG TPA: DNA cytosine methyltransferase [Syntrophobacteraceae bacterium]|nr:DNA cytosine methyltransferase [Syntrophobacteraceae bacterium]